jgi:hypothetical protein
MINQNYFFMKKLLSILIALFTLSTTIYASFPVKEKAVVNATNQSEVVALNQHESNILAPPADFNFGGFILGLLLGLIGVGLAYIFSDDDAFRRSAWYGFGTWLIIWLLLVAAAGA